MRFDRRLRGRQTARASQFFSSVLRLGHASCILRTGTTLASVKRLTSRYNKNGLHAYHLLRCRAARGCLHLAASALSAACCLSGLSLGGSAAWRPSSAWHRNRHGRGKEGAGGASSYGSRCGGQRRWRTLCENAAPTPWAGRLWRRRRNGFTGRVRQEEAWRVAGWRRRHAIAAGCTLAAAGNSSSGVLSCRLLYGSPSRPEEGSCVKNMQHARGRV